MAIFILWMGLFEERPIELGPVDSFTIDGRHIFSAWSHPEAQAILRRFRGKTVRISIEEVACEETEE